MYTSTLIFYVNGEKVTVENPDPEWTLLFYLRYKLGLTGTKEACGEGGCGACTVMLSKVDRQAGQTISNWAVNACLLPLCSIHGLAVLTVEGIGSLRKGLHPVQERIAKSHGSQCGFCTPGFVMSLYALLRNNPSPSERILEEAFQGNLCRCTGYRPILSGFKTFCCGRNGTGCCLNEAEKTEVDVKGNRKSIEIGYELYDVSKFKDYDPSQDILFPPKLLLDKSLDSQELLFQSPTTKFYRPVSWSTLLHLKSEFPEAKILAGNTELGLEAKFKRQMSPVYIQISSIPRLNIIEEDMDGVRIGGGVTLTQLYLWSKSKDSPKGTVYDALVEMIHWFAGPQIRNVATIAGNIVTASPIADLNPILVASESILTLESSNGTRTVKMDEKFFESYRKTLIMSNEVLKCIYIPTTNKNEFIWATKQCRRREDDIAIVNTAMKLTFDPEHRSKITNALLVFGGMAPTTKIAKKASDYLVGKEWTSELIEPVCHLLVQEFPMTPSTPGGMPAYRQSLSNSFFYKFYLHVTQWLSTELVSSIVPPNESELSIRSPFPHLAFKESQLYQLVGKDQPEEDLVGRPIPHAGALKHATGEAAYLDDIPIQPRELFGVLVLNRTVPYGKILSIDPSLALELPGVVDFMDSSSIPGHKYFGVAGPNEPLFAIGEVLCIGQPIGFILAKSQSIAEKAAGLVRVNVEPLSPTLITVEDAIAHNSFLEIRKIKTGDIARAIQESEHVLEGEMRVGGQEQFYLEMQSALAIPKEDDELEVYSSTQGPSSMQQEISACLHIPQNRITVKVRRIGGSFGGKESRSALLAIPAALGARKHNVPVRMICNRYDDMELSGHRPPYLFKYKVGFDSDGHINGIEVKFYLNAGHSRDLNPAIVEITILSFDGTFRIPNWDVEGFACKTHLPPNTAMRGFGNPEGSVVLHTIFERIATKLGMSSLEIRRLHLYKEGDLAPTNQILVNCTAERCLSEVLQNSDFERRQKEIEEYNERNRWKKRGIAVTTTKHNLGFHIAFLNQAGALVMIHLDGSVTLNHGGMEMGQGLHTKMIQIATRVLGIPASKIYFSETSTDKVPNTTATCGSVSSDLNGMAVKNACEILVERLEPYKIGNPKGKWEDWITAAYFDQTNLSAVGFYKNQELDYNFNENSGRPVDYHSYGAAVSEVEIDCLTGDHRVIRSDIVMDIGESLSPAIDVGQVEGAFIQGYGLFVLEELLYTPGGALLTKGPSNYKIPAMNDIPREFHVSILRGSPNPRAVYSSKGIGEPPLTLSNSIFFAIRNAIMAARKSEGIPLDFQFDSPATAERIRLACENQFSVTLSPNTNDLKSSPPWTIYV